ncbi:dynein light chain Tctex-type 1-like [Pectinophora gossypiella]|uniref:dynein light chain Tctex-type 1-like n=1 Tax=Pectinophora gossypiella TaxID=13191 RepID=UPI00214ED16C|nr:dynein light chain Tctex-type 1-like [Pectinophora gossypiella]
MSQQQQPTQEDEEEELVFNIEDVQKIVRDTIELCLGGNTYSHSRTPQWISLITDKTLTRLNKLNKPFKYILRITITQKNGSALHTAAAYFWDTLTDGTCTVRWENKFMYCIVSVWGLALQI